jgi:hypothetical protein
MKKIIIIFVLIFVLISSINSQPIRYNSDIIFSQKNCIDNFKTSSINEKSKFSIGFLPTLFIPEEKLFRKYYSVGYGFTFNTSYKVTNNLKLSGNIEAIFSHLERIDMFDGRNPYETTSKWFSVAFGPKLYINKGTSRFFLNSNFKYTNIYHKIDYFHGFIQKNLEKAVGFNFGFGMEIPINNYFTFEINPSYNLIYPIYPNDGGEFYEKRTYYSISIGLNNNFKI